MKQRQRSRRTRRNRKRQSIKGGAGLAVPIGATNKDTLVFPQHLSARLGDGREATGLLVPSAVGSQEPFVVWAPPAENTFYTLMVFDPDAPARSWLHWLVVNIEGATPSTGETLVRWAPPSPPGGIHRYYICLFKHDARVVQAAPKERGYFKPAEFMRPTGMTPVAATFFRVRADTSK